MEKLSEVISPDCIKVPLESKDKYSAIEELVDLLYAAGKIENKQHLLDAVVAREKTRSTGIGEGLAIPHGKCENVEGVIGAAGKPAQEMEFESIDGKKVDFIVLFGSNINQTGPHIEVLSKLSKLMCTEDFKKRIRQASTADRVYDAIKAGENDQ